MLIKENGLEYWIENNEAAILKVNMPKNIIKIPEQIQNIPITKIAPLVFGNTGVENVSLPSTIRLIGQSAFSDCHRLTMVDFYQSKLDTHKNKTITIADSVFWNCTSLKKIHLNDKPIIVKQKAFAHCTNLMELNGKIKEIHGYCFDGCESLIYLVFDDKSKLHDKALTNANCISGLTFVGNSDISQQTLKFIKNEGIRITCFKNSNLANLAYEGFDITIFKN